MKSNANEYLNEKLNLSRGIEAAKYGIQTSTEAVEHALISMWKMLTGNQPNDKDIEPFFHFISDEGEETKKGLENFLRSKQG